MFIKAKLLFILIGDNNTGKTTLQKFLIEKITNQEWYERLPCDQQYNITHPEIKRKYKTISFANRSFQEKRAAHGDIENYFENVFQNTDIAFISSHLVPDDVSLMIEFGKKWFYNVCAIFFSNSITSNSNANSAISALNWDERFFVENPESSNWLHQLNIIAENLVVLIANRTNVS